MPFANKPNGLQRNADVESPASVEPSSAGGVEWNTTQLFGAAHEVGIRHEATCIGCVAPSSAS